MRTDLNQVRQFVSSFEHSNELSFALECWNVPIS